MYQQILANIRTNLIFYRRNRLLIAVVVFLVMVLGLTTLSSFFFESNTQRLEQLRQLFTTVNRFSLVLTAGLGFVLISQHIRDRSIKMVFTKPCLPETWLLSSYLSAALVAFVLYVGSFLMVSALSLIWKVPYPSGIFFISVNQFFQTVSFMAYATFLSAILHPVLAATVLLVFREGFFYTLKIILASGIKAAGAKPFVPFLKFVKLFLDAAYLALPTFNPYAEKTAPVYSSLRGSDANWNYLFPAVAYALTVSALFYFLTVYALKKKRYV